MPGPGTTVPYWAREADELVAALGSGPRGLSETGAAERLAVVGRNRVEDTRQKGPFRLLLRQFESPLVLILVFAAAVSIGLQQWVDAGIILAIVLGAALLGFTQEYRASTAVAALRRRLALTCRVVRDGVERTVEAETIVPGDVLLLSAGNLGSVLFPRPVDPAQWRAASPGRFQALMFLIYPAASLPILLAYLARFAFGSQLAFYAVLAVGGLFGALVYWIALDSAVRLTASRSEQIVSLLAAREGPVST